MTATATETLTTGQLMELPIQLVVPSDENDRTDLGDVAGLAVSIKSGGQRTPIDVVPNDDGTYAIVAGHRRRAAVELAGLDTIVAVVRERDEKAIKLDRLIENVQREDLGPLDEARGYRRLLDEHGFSQRQLAEEVGRSQGHISKRLALLELPEAIAKKVDSGGIPIADAVELAKLKDHPERLRAAAQGPTYYDVQTRVARHLEEIEKDKLITAREEELESKAITTVRLPNLYSFPKDHLPLKASNAWNALQITATEHKKHNCHVVGLYVDHNGALHEVPLCSDRSQHPAVKTHNELGADGGGRGGQVSDEERKRQEQRKKLEQTAGARREFIRNLLAKKAPFSKADLARLVAGALVDYVEDWQILVEAAKLLGVWPEVDLSETTIAKAGQHWHVVKSTEEDKAGHTIVLAECGFRGLAGPKRPDERDADPPLSAFCPKCADELTEDIYDELTAALHSTIAESEAAANRVAAAIALTAAENSNFNHWGNQWGNTEAEHLALLQAHGYEISKAELAQLSKDARALMPAPMKAAA